MIRGKIKKMVFSHNPTFKDGSNLPNAFLFVTTDGNFAITVFKVFVKQKVVKLEKLDVIPNIHTGNINSLQNTSSS